MPATQEMNVGSWTPTSEVAFADAVFDRLAASDRAVPTSVPRHRRILIPMLVGGSDLFAIREGLIAHALQARGAHVTLVLCDGFTACDARTVDSDSPDACRSCFRTGADRLRRFGLDVLPLSALVDDATSARLLANAAGCPPGQILSSTHRGIDLGPSVYGSTVRYFRVGGLDLGDPVQQAKAREYLGVASVMAEAVRNAIVRFRPDKVFSSHGVYVSWAPWHDVAHDMGVAYDSYGGSWRRNTLMCNHASPIRHHCDDIWDRHRHAALGPAESAELDDYLATRETNAADFYRYFERVDGDVTALEQRLGVRRNDYDRTVALFTNVAWDAAPFRSRGPFADMFAWVTEVVRHAVTRPDVLFLIKVHPAETRYMEDTAEAFRVPNVVREAVGTLPRNVRFISSDDNVSNFTLYRNIDVGLVNTSTVGLEMALAGVPVLTTGAGAHYEKAGIVTWASTREDYFRLLDGLIEGSVEFWPDVETARRYAYTLYFRKPIPFEPLDVDGWSPAALRVQALAELAPGNMPGLDALCEGILEDGVYAVG